MAKSNPAMARSIAGSSRRGSCAVADIESVRSSRGRQSFVDRGAAMSSHDTRAGPEDRAAMHALDAGKAAPRTPKGNSASAIGARCIEHNAYSVR